MDEIALLRSFRSAVPERDREVRDRVRRRVIRRSIRVWVFAAAALIAVAAASSAFGLTNRLVQVVAGDPAPSSVRKAFGMRDRARPRELPIFRTSASMEVVEEQAHAVLGLESTAGLVVLWSAPTRGGGICWMIDIERERRADGAPNATGGCRPAPLPPKVPPVFGTSTTRIGDSSLELIQGEVSEGVTSVEFRYSDGTNATLPVFERFFLGELPKRMQPTLMITRNKNGDEVARQASPPPLRAAAGSIPEPVGPERVLIRLETSSGHPLTFSVAPANGGQICQITRYRGSIGKGCGPDPRTKIEPKELQIHSGLWNEAEDGKPLVSLSGVVGADIASLELRYRDGSVTQVSITERFVYYEIPPAHRGDARFVLLGRDRAGATIARRVIQ
jgi:hypothetical protein